MALVFNGESAEGRDGLIYSLRRIGTLERYIGSTFQPKSARESDHFIALRAGVSPHGKLQKAWDTYGEKKFVFEVLASVKNCSPRALGRLEEFYIELHDATRTGYNRRSNVVDTVFGYTASPQALIPFAPAGQSCAGEALMYKMLRADGASKNLAGVRLLDNIIKRDVDIYALPNKESKLMRIFRNRERAIRDAVLEWQKQHPLIVEGRPVRFLQSDVNSSDPKYRGYVDEVQGRQKQLLN